MKIKKAKRRRIFRNSLKNIFIKTTTAFAFMSFCVAASCVDMESFVPVVVLIASTVWISLFCKANGWFWTDNEDDALDSIRTVDCGVING